MSRLLEAYNLAEMKLRAGQIEPEKVKNLLKNRAEMFSYNLIATASSMDSLKHICNIDWDLYPSDEEKSLIYEAIRIH